MNQLDLSDYGGHPFVVDDAIFLQSALAEGVKGSLSQFLGLANPNFRAYVILGGCVITEVGSTYTYTEGFVLLNNAEVYYVPAQGVAQPKTAGGQYNFTFGIVFDPAGNVTNEDGSTSQCYQIRQGVIAHTVSPPSGLIVDDSRRWVNAVASMLINSGLASKSVDTWHQVGAAGEPAYGTSFGATLVGGENLFFKKNDMGMVTIQGRFNCTGPGGSTTIFTLPAGYFNPALSGPALLTGVCLKYASGSALVAYPLSVTHANGQVVISDPTSGTTPPSGTYIVNLQYQL